VDLFLARGTSRSMGTRTHRFSFQPRYLHWTPILTLPQYPRENYPNCEGTDGAIEPSGDELALNFGPCASMATNFRANDKSMLKFAIRGMIMILGN